MSIAVFLRLEAGRRLSLCLSLNVMKRLLVGVCTFVLSSVGWYIGSELWGVFSAFVLSTVGMGVGIYLGRQLAERWGA